MQFLIGVHVITLQPFLVLPNIWLLCLHRTGTFLDFVRLRITSRWELMVQLEPTSFSILMRFIMFYSGEHMRLQYWVYAQKLNCLLINSRHIIHIKQQQFSYPSSFDFVGRGNQYQDLWFGISEMTYRWVCCSDFMIRVFCTNISQ